MEKRLERFGCRLAYDIVGDGERVLFVQGVGVAGSGWRPQIDALSSSCRCLSFDNRGLGRSQPAAQPITVERMADDAGALLDAEGWDRVHLVGHSLGGPVVLELALAAPRRVATLTLLSTFSGSRTAAPLTPRLMWLGARTRIGTRTMRRRGFLALVTAPGAISPAESDSWSQHVSELFGHDIADQPPIAAAQLEALRSYDPGSRLATLAGIPTLVVSGRHDPIAPPSAGRALAAAIPGARYVEVDDASHGLPITHADLVNRLLAQHFELAPAA